MEGTWACCVLKDLRWYAKFPGFSVASTATFSEWVDLVVNNYKACKKLIIKTTKSKWATCANEWAQRGLNKDMGKHFACDVCDIMLASKQQLCLHRFKKHGLKSIERKYLATTHCPICLMEFHTRERVLNHVKFRSDICRELSLVRKRLWNMTLLTKMLWPSMLTVD